MPRCLKAMGACGSISGPADPARNRRNSAILKDAIAGLQQAAGVSAGSDRKNVSTSASSQPPRLFVFDFDLTIAKYHVWGTYKNTPLAQVPITQKTFVDLAAFRAFVAAMREVGHHIAIASFGRKDVVDKAMRFALGEDHGLVISTPADHGCKDGSSNLGSKNIQLQALAERFSVVQPNLIVFFDDDHHNVEEALRIGVGAIYTPNGLTKNVLAKATNSLRKSQFKA